MVTALEEISKIYSSIEAELKNYLGLFFDPLGSARERTQERKVLLGLEGGEHDTRMEKARGHCHKIANIYKRYLDPWFASVLNPSESR